MRIIGLTGGIASGKSTVTDILRSLGARVIDIDAIARQVVEPGRPAWEEIVGWLGQDFLLADGNLDRKKLGELVFGNSEARVKLEGFTHPRIAAEARRQCAAAEIEGITVTVMDVPLLFEVGWDKQMDEIWVVFVDEKTQMERLMARDKMTSQQAQARIDAQLSLAEKARLADVVIDNSKNLEHTREQVREAWRRAMEQGAE